MPKGLPKVWGMTKRDYRQRPRVNAPHISLGDARAIAGLTLDEVCARFEEATGDRLTRGALSAIENGLRGASDQTLRGIALALGLRGEAIRTDYIPRSRERSAA